MIMSSSHSSTTKSSTIKLPSTTIIIIVLVSLLYNVYSIILASSVDAFIHNNNNNHLSSNTLIRNYERIKSSSRKKTVTPSLSFSLSSSSLSTSTISALTATATTTADLTTSSEGNNPNNNQKGKHNKKNNNNNNIKKMKKKHFHSTTSVTNNHNSNYNNNNSSSSKNKHRIRAMFREAKDMERTGQWRQACIHFKKILELDPYDSHSYLALGRLQSKRERGGGGSGAAAARSHYRHLHSNNDNMNNDHDHLQHLSTKRGISDDKEEEKGGGYAHSTTEKSIPFDMDNANNVTPLSIFESEPKSEARHAFYEGTEKCPDSIHLWQAWALHEQSQGNTAYARTLFEKALSLDETNPYVCHGYGLMEHRYGNFEKALDLWERPLKTRETDKTTAALVCSVGKLLVAKGELKKARDLYMRHVLKIKSEREKCEVYLAAAWLEEKHFLNVNRAEELLQLALRVSPGNSRALVALARLAGRKVDLEKLSKNNNASKTEDVVRQRQLAVKNQLKQACDKMIKAERPLRKIKGKESEVLDGRLFNAWADMEVKNKNYNSARKILMEGRNLFPNDQTLLQSAGKLEERVGNFTGARDFYGESLMLKPSAPTLVAYALLELNHPLEKSCNYTKVERLFQEAILLDPRHGPVYNAYGNMQLKRGKVESARQIYQNGVFAHCRDVSSVYHGLAMLELSLGNVETARLVLVKGLKEVKINDGMMDNSRRKRSQFLTHTLGMLELNSNRAVEAKLVFEAGLERHVNSSQLLLGSALAEVKLGKEDSARNLFERSVQIDRRHAQAWQSWGVMEMRAGNYKIAKTLFQCGLKNNPTHGALWQAYATMESRLGNFEIARALFAAGVSRCPNHVPLYQAWACLEIRGENYDKAKTLIGEALTRDKTEGSGWLVAAKIEEKLGNEGLMIMILRRGLECAPNSAELYCAVADYEVRHGKIDLARNLLEKGLEVDPLHAPLYHSLAELEARVCNIQGLAELNKRAAQIFSNNALEPPPISMNLLGTKLRKSAQSKKKMPNNINTLAQQLDSYNNGEHLDVEEAINDMDPDIIIDKMTQIEDNDDIDAVFLTKLEYQGIKCN